MATLNFQNNFKFLRASICGDKIADIGNTPLYVSNNGCCSSLHHPGLRTILVSGKGFQDGWEHVPEVRILIFLVVVIQGNDEKSVNGIDL